MNNSGKKVIFHDMHPKEADLCSEVLAGLQRNPKKISPKFFYDRKGSELFHQITQAKEYYLTDSEQDILRNQGEEIGKEVGEDRIIIEYGCGNSEKIHLLLDHLQKPQAYVAIDISKSPLKDLTEDLAHSYPFLEIHAICADFTQPLVLPLNGAYQPFRRTAFFPGSSIGNFDPTEARQFLKNIREDVGSDGGLIIGVDLKKDPEILNAAYNDAEGLTEAFNKNLLTRINRECQASFELENFSHRAFYDDQHGRIEMHLESRLDHTVQVGRHKIHFQEGESIHTENSYKYHVEEFQKIGQSAGWKPKKVWRDSQGFFSLHLWKPA